MTNINIAIFGMGRMGNIHANNLLNKPNTTIAAICDPFSKNIEELADKYNTICKTEEQIFADDSINVVFITSATSTHADLLMRAIAAGKNIFCEKPIDLDINNVLKIEKLAKQSSLKIGMGFNRRHDINFMQLKEAILREDIGKIEMIHIISKDPYPPPVSYLKHSGGMIRDMTIHDLDMFNFLIEDDITEVYAQGSSFNSEIKSEGDIDSAQICIKTKSGILGNITNSRHSSYGYDQRIEVFGSKGRLNVDNVPRNFLTTTNENSTSSSIYLDFFIDRYMDAFKNEIDSFIGYLEEKNDYRANFADGVKASKLAEIVISSMDSNTRISVDHL